MNQCGDYPMKPLYDTDFRLWLAEQATLLRTGHVDKLDAQNLAEEIQSLFELEPKPCATSGALAPSQAGAVHHLDGLL